MSYESLRFGWQKLLINQVPRKGGKSYGPPPPDYAGQWTAAQNAFTKSERIIAEVSSTYGQIASNPAAAPGIVTNNNAKLNAEIANFNSIINQVNGIPDYIFTNGSLSKSEAVGILTSSRNNLQACVSVVPNPPPPPPPPPAATPSLAGTSPLSAPIALPTASSPLNTIIKTLATTPPPVIIKPSEEAVPSTSPLKASIPGYDREGIYVPTGKIDGVGTYVPGTPFNRGLPALVVHGQDGKSYRHPQLVPLGIQWSYKRWRWQPDNIQPPPPPPIRPVPPPPSEVQIIQQEINRQTEQLQKINRILNKPIEPAVPEEIYPSTSWQYEFWKKGYSLHEINYAEDQAAQKKLLETTKGDFALFKVKVEDLLQDAILNNIITKPIVQELVPGPIIGFDPGTGRPTVAPEYIWWLNPQPYQPPSLSPREEPIRCPVPTPVVELPQPYLDENNNPINPKLIPRALRRRRVFQPRNVLFQEPDLNDLPGIRTCGTNTLPKKDNWEDCLVGAGASVAELDTVRRCMAISKLQPNADICTVAKNMLITVRNQVAIRNQSALPPEKLILPDVATTPYQPPAEPRPLNPFTLYSGNDMNSIPGVRWCGTSAVNVVRSNTIAQRKAQQARRGAVINRNRGPSSGGGLSGSF